MSDQSGDRPTPDHIEQLYDLAYEGWCVIANAMGDNMNEEWRQAAIRWRDKYHLMLNESATITEQDLRDCYERENGQPL